MDIMAELKNFCGDIPPSAQETEMELLVYCGMRTILARYEQEGLSRPLATNAANRLRKHLRENRGLPLREAPEASEA